LQFITFRFELLGEYETDKLCIVLSTSEDFSSDISIWGGEKVNDSDTSYFESTIFLSGDADTYYCTLAQTNSSNVSLSASKGYGPFLETYEIRNTFTLSGLPDDVNEVIFYFLHEDSAIIDSVDVTGSNMDSATCESKWAFCPKGTHLFVKASVSSAVEYELNYHKYITITPLSPHIYVSNPILQDFFYQIGDDSEKTFHVDSLPSNTSKVKFEAS
jgi:hypothetical protein